MGWMDGLRGADGYRLDADRLVGMIGRSGVGVAPRTRDACLLIASGGADAMLAILGSGADGPVIDEALRIVVSLTRMALDGEFGDGAERMRWLGPAYDAVQAEVNGILSRERFL